VLSFLSGPGPLICAGPAQAHIEPGRAGLGSGPNSGLRAEITGLMLIGHLYSVKSLICKSACGQDLKTAPTLDPTDPLHIRSVWPIVWLCLWPITTCHATINPQIIRCTLSDVI
jgi:hypothetical protein